MGLELARVLTDAARVLAEQQSVDAAAQRIVELALTVVPGADSASLSLARTGALQTVAATDELAVSADAAQYDAGDGPCLRVLPHARVLRAGDLAADARWPRFRERAVELGVHGVVACHLPTRDGGRSALNLYAREPGALDEGGEAVAELYATHAAIALATALREEDLRTAVASRETISQALGILMQRHRIKSDQAFQLLSTASQKLNIKVRRLAEIICDTGIDPRDTAELARQAAREAGTRANELHNRLAEKGPRIGASGPRHLTEANRRAQQAAARAADRLQRTMTAYLSAADAHERAAVVHERIAANGLKADREHHLRQAEEHRQAAAASRQAVENGLSRPST
ncbi:GAF and ANTAR domain-containing protein [Saccharothrix xinjiangensis]|uniref:GAF and ANTAR domain-containing protein n=1 Tax=Saccharothrix xinjiangensis TaxID=204798 RepID=A0ABV9Y6F6_9PSEU